MFQYRRDIDGLRALAVIPVVLFHAEFPLLSGGFVGVDVFFVISGYLITQQLLVCEISWRSIAAFYERRVRRIAPALLTLLLVLTVATVMLLPSADTLRAAKNALASLLFLANIRFHEKAGYFAVGADEEPLLHTWSLAVEEQFYLLFPFVILLLRRWESRAVIPVLLAMAAGSLMLSEVKLSDSPSYSFYLLPSRAWELLAGAILAALGERFRSSGHLREGSAGAGLLMIVVPMLSYDAATPFPGVMAVPPVLGTVLLIATGPDTRTAQLLCLRPLVAIGLISYSLYLWHWPLLVVSRQVIGGEFAPKIIVVLVSIALAYLSYRFVEQPFRRCDSFGRKRLLAWTGSMALLIAGASGALISSQGWPSRSPAAEAWYRSTAKLEADFQSSPCLAMGAELPPVMSCRRGVGSPAIQGVLWGDSHAAHWAPMIDDVARANGLTFRQLTKAGCPPLLVSSMYPIDAHRQTCPSFNREAFNFILANPGIRYIVLAANWQGVLDGDLRAGIRAIPRDTASSIAMSRHALAVTARRLREKGKTVIFIGQTPIPDENVVQCIGRRRFIGLDEATCGRFSLNVARRRDVAAMDFLAGPAGDRGRIISPLHRFCDRTTCFAIDDGRLRYIDAAHLAPEGARRLAPDLTAALAR